MLGKDQKSENSCTLSKGVQLKENIFVAITDFIMFSDKPQYKSDHVILDKESYSHDLKDFSFAFLELPKLNKTIDELSNIVEKWAIELIATTSGITKLFRQQIYKLEQLWPNVFFRIPKFISHSLAYSVYIF